MGFPNLNPNPNPHLDHVGDVRRPAVEAIEDVRAVDDARAALLALLREKLEQVLLRVRVRVRARARVRVSPRVLAVP